MDADAGTMTLAVASSCSPPNADSEEPDTVDHTPSTVIPFDNTTAVVPITAFAIGTTELIKMSTSEVIVY